MEDDIIVIFETDDYRGDHASDVEYAVRFRPHTTLSDLIAEAVRLQTTNGVRATIRIVPVTRPTKGDRT